MAKITQKERKKNKEIAKQIMEHYDINYNDWLHEMHTNYIDEHLMDYMKEQGSKKSPSKEEEDSKNSVNNEDKENSFNS